MMGNQDWYTQKPRFDILSFPIYCKYMPTATVPCILSHYPYGLWKPSPKPLMN